MFLLRNYVFQNFLSIEDWNSLRPETWLSSESAANMAVNPASPLHDLHANKKYSSSTKPNPLLDEELESLPNNIEGFETNKGTVAVMLQLSRSEQNKQEGLSGEADPNYSGVDKAAIQLIPIQSSLRNFHSGPSGVQGYEAQTSRSGADLNFSGGMTENAERKEKEPTVFFTQTMVSETQLTERLRLSCGGGKRKALAESLNKAPNKRNSSLPVLNCNDLSMPEDHTDCGRLGTVDHLALPLPWQTYKKLYVKQEKSDNTQKVDGKLEDLGKDQLIPEANVLITCLERNGEIAAILNEKQVLRSGEKKICLLSSQKLTQSQSWNCIQVQCNLMLYNMNFS